MSQVILDTERQAKAKVYARIQRRLMLVDLAIGALYVVAWLVLGWSAALKSYLLGWTANDWLLVAAYGLVFGAGIFVLGLPLSYYSGFVLPHRFDLSNETLKGWIGDQVKSILIGGVLGGFLLGLGGAMRIAMYDFLIDVKRLERRLAAAPGSDPRRLQHHAELPGFLSPNARLQPIDAADRIGRLARW